LVKVYSNPTRGHINIDIKPNVTIKIYDLTGKLILSFPFLKDTCNLDFSEYD